jgi:flagellar hook-length control protein FliK
VHSSAESEIAHVAWEQSASVSQAFVESLSQVPSETVSPGAGSFKQLPVVLMQATALDLPQLESAAHGTAALRQRRERP